MGEGGDNVNGEADKERANGGVDGTKEGESSAPAMTNTGMSPTACNNDSAFLAERMVSDDNLLIS